MVSYLNRHKNIKSKPIVRWILILEIRTDNQRGEWGTVVVFLHSTLFLNDLPVVWLGILNRFSIVVSVTTKYKYPMAWVVPRRPYTTRKQREVAYFWSHFGLKPKIPQLFGIFFYLLTKLFTSKKLSLFCPHLVSFTVKISKMSENRVNFLCFPSSSRLVFQTKQKISNVRHSAKPQFIN